MQPNSCTTILYLQVLRRHKAMFCTLLPTSLSLADTRTATVQALERLLQHSHTHEKKPTRRWDSTWQTLYSHERHLLLVGKTRSMFALRRCWPYHKHCQMALLGFNVAFVGLLGDGQQVQGCTQPPLTLSYPLQQALGSYPY